MSHRPHDHHDHHDDHHPTAHGACCNCSMCALLKELVAGLRQLLQFLENRPTAIAIYQLEGGNMNPITGTVAGTSTSSFGEAPTPTGSAFPAGTTFTWTVDDTADISLTPSASGTSVAVACSATPTQTSYNLTCTSSYTPTGASAPLAVTANVPILPASATTPTGMTIGQLTT